MEKKKEFTTVCDARLASFEGFYCSIWSPDDDIYYYGLENGFEEDKDFTFDYRGYYKAICEEYTEAWKGWMQQYIHEDIKLDFIQDGSHVSIIIIMTLAWFASNLPTRPRRRL